MPYPLPLSLPDDWAPHVGVVKDKISLRHVGEHFPQTAFLYEDGDERDAIRVTGFVKKGRPFAEVERWARTRLLERARERARSAN